MDTKMENERVKTVEEEIEEGKQRDDIFNSFRGVGIAEVILGSLMFIMGIGIVVGAVTARGPRTELSQVGNGIWCSFFGIAAGIMGLITSYKVTYCTVGWSMIISMVASFFMLIFFSIEIPAVIACLDWAYGLVIAHVAIMIIGMALFTLCIYSSVVYGRLFKNFPYYSPGVASLCSCCCSAGEHPNFANVMYSTVNFKRHDA